MNQTRSIDTLIATKGHLAIFQTKVTSSTTHNYRPCSIGGRHNNRRCPIDTGGSYQSSGDLVFERQKWLRTPPSQRIMYNTINAIKSALFEPQVRSIDQLMTKGNTLKAIMNLPLNNVAGADGLRGEFLGEDAHILATITANLMDQITSTSSVSLSCLANSTIFLLYKRGSPHIVENQRPVALVNVLAKILSSVYCNRIRPLLGTIIPNSQTGFVPGSTIIENIILTFDVMH